MKGLALVLVASTCGLVYAQSRLLNVQPRRTNDYDETRTSGYCTVRLRVDDEVVVHIRGNRLGFETVRGRDASDEGSECSQAMPAGGALANFRFRGVDGRGRVTLAEPPSSGNRYTALVRIQDTKGGDEGYTFKVEWENRNPGQSAGAWNGLGGRQGQGSGWGSGSQSGGSGWGPGAQTGSSNWGSGSNSSTWYESDFQGMTAGSGTARMAGQPDLRLTSTSLRLRRNGQFQIEIVGAETVRFNGSWRRDGDTAILNIRDGFSDGGASGTGRVAIVNNEVQSLTLEGRNRRTNAAFTVEFRGRGTGRRSQW